MSHTTNGSARLIGDVGERIAIAFLQCNGFCVTLSPPGSKFDLKAERLGESKIVEVKTAVALDKSLSSSTTQSHSKTRFRAGFTFSSLEFHLAVFVVFDYGKCYINCFDVCAVKTWTFTSAGATGPNAKRLRLFMYRHQWLSWKNAFDLPTFVGQSKVCKQSWLDLTGETSASLFDASGAVRHA